jgi:thiamine biosynthesis lipoprotein ApbE
MSFFDEKSEVSLLNCQAHLRLVKVSSEVFEVLNFAKNLFEI